MATRPRQVPAPAWGEGRGQWLPPRPRAHGGASAAPAPLCFAPSGDSPVLANHKASGKGRKGEPANVSLREQKGVAAGREWRQAPAYPCKPRSHRNINPGRGGVGMGEGREGETRHARGGDRWGGRRWAAAQTNQRPARQGSPTNMWPALQRPAQSEKPTGGPRCRRGGRETVTVGGDEWRARRPISAQRSRAGATQGASGAGAGGWRPLFSPQFCARER